jgi:tripartite-type tricarboxylate transporter receptor subunit TctC
VVPYPPGGVVDVVARTWTEKIKQSLGNIYVENLAGGGGTIGAANVARSRPDGYSLLFGETSCLIIAPALMTKPPYDPAKDFTPISMVATSSTSIVVHPSVPVSNLKELAAYAKANPSKLSYGSAGTGTVTHLAGELFKQLIGVSDILHVPYRGAGPALIDTMAGVIPMTTPNITGQILEQHRAGKIRILAVCAPERFKAAPDIPAASEEVPGLVMQLTAGLVAAAGMPEPIVAQLADATSGVLKDPDFLSLLQKSGLEARRDASPAAARAFLTEERARLLPIMKAAGLEPQ